MLLFEHILCLPFFFIRAQNLSQERGANKSQQFDAEPSTVTNIQHKPAYCLRWVIIHVLHAYVQATHNCWSLALVNHGNSGQQ